METINSIYGAMVSAVSPTKSQQSRFHDVYNKIYNKRRSVTRARHIRLLCENVDGRQLTDVEILARLKLVVRGGTDTYYFDGKLLVVL